jgi:hypothetical protein
MLQWMCQVHCAELCSKSFSSHHSIYSSLILCYNEKAVLNNLRIWIFTSYMMWCCIGVSPFCKRMQRLHLNWWGSKTNPWTTQTPSISEFLAQHCIPVVLHVPYSPSLTPLPPPASSCFPWWRSHWRGKDFKKLQTYKLNAAWYLRAIQK